MGHVLEASVELKNGRMMFEGESGGHTVMTDYIPPHGDGQGFMPLQLFLVSLASCLGGTITFLAKTMNKEVKELLIGATGTRREQHPLCFETIALSARVVSADMDDETMQKILESAEEKICPVMAMIKGNVKITTTYQIFDK
jgi:putative redox protein